MAGSGFWEHISTNLYTKEHGAHLCHHDFVMSVLWLLINCSLLQGVQIETAKSAKSTASRSAIKIKVREALIMSNTAYFEFTHVCLLQSYRIRTPPLTENKWNEDVIELDPKSDSSAHGDLLVSLVYLC